MTVSTATLNKFVGRARHLDHVSIDDLRIAFPIDTMEADDIATIITRLEDANVSVDIDPGLFFPRHGNALTSLRVRPSKTKTVVLDQTATPRSALTNRATATPRPAAKNLESNGSDRITDGSSGKFRSQRSIAWLLVLVLATIALMSIWLARA